MNQIVIDFETYCDLDIKKVGAFKYAHHPSCRVICMSYKIDNNMTQIWTPELTWADDLAKALQDNKLLYTFNATFEYLIWNIVGHKSYPEYFVHKNISQFRDIKALCARYRMPQNLKQAAIALNCTTEKMAIGTQLIRLCCTPGHYPIKQNFKDLYMYCIIDTDVAAEILDRLPANHLIKVEQELWELTYRMNERGVPIDEQAVDSIIEYLAVYMDTMKAVLPEVTNGFVNTPGQVQKIKQFCKMKGVTIPNVQAETITKILENGETLPEDVKTVLEVRQLVGMSSVKKFITIKNLVLNGVVQGNLNYHGAGTGRWAGYGFQYHNLPRAKRKDPEKWIQRFINKEPIEKPVEIAKALIRPMIKAPPGYKFIISDYKSIEYVMLVWFCDDWEALKLINQGLCQYTDMAAFLHKKELADVQPQERQMGKVIILGCGYQMGKKRFRAVAADWGFKLTDAAAEQIILAYRTKYSKVAKMWKIVNKATIEAVRNPGKQYKTHKCIFKVVTDRVKRNWLRITLPSERGLMYADPHIDDDIYGPVVKYTGLNSKTHQMNSLALTPGLITENIVQAAARDVLANGKLMVEKHMPEVSLSISVHDEAGGLIKDEDIKAVTMARFNLHMCTKLPWMDGLPLDAEGYIAQRYRKD